MHSTTLPLKMKKVISAILLFPFLALIWVYQKAISPFTPSACRYYPTCSEYSKISIKKHGVFKGGILTFVRILKCSPFGTSGVDEVPQVFEFKKLIKKQ